MQNSFKELFTESKLKYEIYYVKGELWTAYGQGSGSVVQLPFLNKYLNSDPSDEGHYESDVDRIVKSVKGLKPIKKKGNTSLYEIPEYPILTGEYGKSYDIWGGTIKPIGKIYMVITEEKSTIINFFEKKNEALAWMRSISN